MFDEVVQCGGLRPALDPGIAAKHLEPDTQRGLIHCEGVNYKSPMNGPLRATRILCAKWPGMWRGKTG